MGGVCLPSSTSVFPQLDLQFLQELRSPYLTTDLFPHLTDPDSRLQSLIQMQFMGQIINYCTERCSCLSRGTYFEAEKLSQRRATEAFAHRENELFGDWKGDRQDGQQEKGLDDQEDTGI
jgi:hypothetical protein